MLHVLVDGFITYRQGPEAAPGWEFDLEVDFGPRASEVSIFDLDRMQHYCTGDLDIERLPNGAPRIHRTVVAHGPESAHKQARDLSDLFSIMLGLRTNVARAGAH